MSLLISMCRCETPHSTSSIMMPQCFTNSFVLKMSCIMLRQVSLSKAAAPFIPDVGEILVRAHDKHCSSSFAEERAAVGDGIKFHHQCVASAVEHMHLRVSGITFLYILYVAEGDILRDYILPQGASRDSAEIVHQGFESASVEITGHVHKLRADDHVALCHTGARIVDNDIQQSNEGIRVIKGTEIFDDGFLFQGVQSFPESNIC